jgi:hypothetical protein
MFRINCILLSLAFLYTITRPIGCIYCDLFCIWMRCKFVDGRKDNHVCIVKWFGYLFCWYCCCKISIKITFCSIYIIIKMYLKCWCVSTLCNFTFINISLRSDCEWYCYLFLSRWMTSFEYARCSVVIFIEHEKKIYVEHAVHSDVHTIVYQ